MKYFVLIISVFFLISCAPYRPFTPVELTPVKDTDPERLITEFEGLLPEKFSLIETVTFRYRGRMISGIGYTQINIPEKEFAVACFNPAGIKLFQVQFTEQEIKTNFVLDKLGSLGNVSKTVAETLKRIYLKRTPSDKAWIKKQKQRIIFQEKEQEGKLRYIFGAKDNYLINKQYYENNDLVWEVFYYNWHLNKGKIYPKGIFFQDHKYKYQLVFKLKEIRK